MYPKLEKPGQKRRKNLVILVIILKSLKKLEMPTIRLSKKLKELCDRNFCRTKIEKMFFKIKTNIRLL